MKRRQALLSICATVAGTGCLRTGSQQSKQARIAWIWLLNDRNESYEVDIVVEDDGATVFSGSYELGPDPNTANIHVDNPVDGLGQYIVRTTLDGKTIEVDTTDVIDEKENCVGIRFSLLNNGSADYWTKSTQQC